MASIYIYSYNNYFNRIVKKEESLSGYGSPVYSESKVNFNPNDGVNATFVSGRMTNDYQDDGDYLIYSQDNVNITSRWFIIESKKIGRASCRERV